MDKKQMFYERLAVIFDKNTAEIQDKTLLKELWDSLATLAVVAAADEIYDKVVSGKDIVKCDTAGELFEFVEQYDEE